MCYFFCHFFCYLIFLRICVPVCHHHGCCHICYRGLPDFCRNGHSADGRLSGISVRLFLPDDHYVRLFHRRVCRCRGYFCCRLCLIFLFFHFCPVFRFFPDVCPVLFLLPASLFSLEPVSLLLLCSVPQGALPDGRYLPASVFPVRNSDGFRRIFFL